MTNARLILDLILDKARTLKASGHSVQFVFDLDSTLFCVSPRTEQILKDFALLPEMRERFPEGCVALQKVRATPQDWGIRSILERLGVKVTLSFFEHLRAHWVEFFFSNYYLKYDEPYEGAVEFVNQCHNIGIEIGYLTGRDEQRMKMGTLESFRQHGLPVSPVGGLNMKPHSQYEDGHYKLDYFMQYLQSKKAIHTWFFENEPVILNKVREQVPDLNCIFVETVHSGREQVPPEIPRLGFNWTWTKS